METHSLEIYFTCIFSVPRTYWMLKKYLLNEYICWMHSVFDATRYLSRACSHVPGEEKWDRSQHRNSPGKPFQVLTVKPLWHGHLSGLLQAQSALRPSEGQGFLMLAGAIPVWLPWDLPTAGKKEHTDLLDFCSFFHFVKTLFLSQSSAYHFSPSREDRLEVRRGQPGWHSTISISGKKEAAGSSLCVPWVPSIMREGESPSLYTEHPEIMVRCKDDVSEVL